MKLVQIPEPSRPQIDAFSRAVYTREELFAAEREAESVLRRVEKAKCEYTRAVNAVGQLIEACASVIVAHKGTNYLITHSGAGLVHIDTVAITELSL